MVVVRGTRSRRIKGFAVTNAQEQARKALAEAEQLLTEGSPGASADWIEAAQAYVDQLRAAVRRAEDEERRDQRGPRGKRRSLGIPPSLTLRLHGR
jgi:capsule polysaccharide export protein KpsE/RkpR